MAVQQGIVEPMDWRWVIWSDKWLGVPEQNIKSLISNIV
jgi:hypothetical protein